MIKIKKEEFNILNLFIPFVNVKSPNTRSFIFKSIGNNKAILFQSSVEGTIYHICNEIEYDKDFKYAYDTLEFNNLIKLFQNDLVINIDDDCIFNSQSEYVLEKLKYDYDSIIDFKEVEEEILKLNTLPNFSISKDTVEKIDLAKYSIGAEEHSYLTFNKGYLTALDLESYTSLIKISEKFDNNTFIPKSILGILQYLKITKHEFNKLTFYFSQKYNCTILKIGNSVLFLNHAFTCNIPNIMEQKEDFIHPLKINIDKDSLKNSLQRINVVSSSNYGNRSKLSINKEDLIFECNDSFNRDYVTGKGVKVKGKGKEILHAEIDSRLEGYEFYITTNNILKVLPYFKEEIKLIIYLPEDIKDSSVFAISNEDQTKIYLFYYECI
jgi:hypothetical protein